MEFEKLDKKIDDLLNRLDRKIDDLDSSKIERELILSKAKFEEQKASWEGMVTEVNVEIQDAELYIKSSIDLLSSEKNKSIKEWDDILQNFKGDIENQMIDLDYVEEETQIKLKELNKMILDLENTILITKRDAYESIFKTVNERIETSIESIRNEIKSIEENSNQLATSTYNNIAEVKSQINELEKIKDSINCKLKEKDEEVTKFNADLEDARIELRKIQTQFKATNEDLLLITKEWIAESEIVKRNETQLRTESDEKLQKLIDYNKELNDSQNDNWKIVMEDMENKMKEKDEEIHKLYDEIKSLKEDWLGIQSQLVITNERITSYEQSSIITKLFQKRN